MKQKSSGEVSNFEPPVKCSNRRFSIAIFTIKPRLKRFRIVEMKEMTYMITDFSDFANHQWKIVNDGVMGGYSRSHLQIQSDGHALFLGELTTANSGGFASVKNIHSVNLKGYNTIVLRVKGDGKQYSFRFKTAQKGRLNEWSYESRFWTVSQQWQTIDLPIKDFYPVYRGKILHNMPQPDLANIREYGLMVSQRQEGQFRIEINYLEAVAK